ncbi:redoxin family protein [Sphingobacterium cellulitidis]|uniref:redoxin family protein n=1 Tax=Sphingobacterium cellulitidis TaxID=1768011 RepID=UPI003C7E27D2
MVKLYTFLFFLLGSLFLNSTSFAQGAYSIEAEIDSSQNLNGKYVSISFVDYAGINNLKKDSVLIQNNRFVFKGNLVTPGVLTNLFINEKEFDGLFQFLLTPGTNKLYVHKPLYNQITGKLITGISNVEVMNSENAIIYNRYNSIFQVVFPELNWAMNRNQDPNEIFHKLNKETLPLRVELVKMYPNSYASLYFQRYFLFDVLEDKPNICKELFDGLAYSIKLLPEAKELELKIKTLFSIQKGEKVKDFVIKDENSQEVRLSDFMGKKVLLEFWASWCGPCIENLPNLKKFAEENPNIQILAISLDDNEDNWKEAIKKHKFNYAKHVSELKGWKGEVSNTLFNVNAIPRAILIDENGNFEDLDFKINSVH